MANLEQEKALRQRVIDILFADGYPDYALALNGFKRVVPLPVARKNIGCTDYENIYLKPTLTDEEISIVVRHEMLHVMLRHKARMTRQHKPNTWNLACDYELSNYYSAHDDKIMERSPILSKGCSVAIDAEYTGMTAEEIYQKMIDDRRRKQQEQEEQQQQEGSQSTLELGSGSGDFNSPGSSSQKPEDEENDQEDDQEKEEQDDEQEKEGGEEAQEDESDDKQDDQDRQDGDGQGDGEDSESESDNDEPGENEQPDLSDEEIAEQLERELSELADQLGDLSQDEQDQLRDAIKQAVEDGYGNLSPEQQDQMANSEVVESSGADIAGSPAEQLPVRPMPDPQVLKLKYSLHRFFVKQENVDKAHTYRRPNKKYAGSGIIMKGWGKAYKPTKTLAVYVDISGSMTMDKLGKALGVVEELKKIKRTSLIIKYFNTSIHEKFCPGGGTDYNCVMQDAKKNDYKCVAIITDDTPGYFTENYKLEALWIAGIEQPNSYKNYKNYKLEYDINKPGSQIQTKYFGIAIIEPDKQ